MKHSIPTLSALLTALALPAHASPDARVTRTVLAQNLATIGFQDGAAPGKTLVDPNEIFFSPDGARLAYLPAPASPDAPRRVVLDGKEGPVLVAITDETWSSAGRSFLYIGRAKGATTDTLYSNNTPTPIVGEKMDAVCAVDVPDKTGTSGLAAYQKGGKIFISTAAAPASIPSVPTGVFLAPSGDDAYIEATQNGQPALWHGAEFLGESARFGDGKPPFEPVWSPVHKHAAFIIQVGDKQRLCVDATPISDLAARPRLLWNATGTQLLVFGTGLPTAIIGFGADGIPIVQKTVGESARGDAVWSQNGAHFAFFSAQTGKIVVDGEPKTEPNKFTEGEKDLETDPILRARFNAPSVAVSNDGHFAGTSAFLLFSGTPMSTLAIDGSTDHDTFDKILDVRWSEKLGRPIFLLIQGSYKDPTTAGFAVHLGSHDDIDLTPNLPIANNVRPLFPLTLVAPDLARVVLLEGDQIARYDIQLRAK